MNRYKIACLFLAFSLLAALVWLVVLTNSKTEVTKIYRPKSSAREVGHISAPRYVSTYGYGRSSLAVFDCRLR